MEFTTKPFESVHNLTCNFYKLFVDGKCQYDEFEEEVCKNAQDLKALKSILATMDNYSPNLRLPPKKFRHIESNTRQNIYEFKKDKLRVYVILKQPDVFVVLGGYKKDQSKDIAKINRDLADFLNE